MSKRSHTVVVHGYQRALEAKLPPNAVDHFRLALVHLYAALAEKERVLISQRTRPALAAKKVQGVKLGNPGAAEAAVKAHAANRAVADQLAANVLPIVREIQQSGLTTLRDIAGALNAQAIRTARGGA